MFRLTQLASQFVGHDFHRAIDRAIARAVAGGLVLIVGLLLLTPATAEAQAHGNGPWGIGIVLGDPSAITAKYIADQKVAYDMGLSFSFDRWIFLYGDWLWHVPGALGHANDFVARTTPYIGAGGLFVISNRNAYDRRRDRYFETSANSTIAIGARFPLGLEWKPASVPLGVFVEIVPGMTIIPATMGFVQAGIGARFFF